MTWSPGRRVAMVIGAATSMVVVIAALVPRGYLANDDIGVTEYLRKDAFTPWISPILAQAFGFAYRQAPDVPWYGLFQYALITGTGAVLIHTCTELIDRRLGLAQIVTLLGALVIGASHAILVIGITWTTVSIAAIGTALAAFVAHAQICQVAGKPMSRLRALVYGLLFVAGYMLRLQGLSATVVALAPLLGWTAWRFVQRRHLPRPSAVIAFVAPFALVFAIQDRIPQARGAEVSWFTSFNDARGRIHGYAAYDGLDRRAPELLAQAGWTVEEYRDFASWLIIDEADYSVEKMERLIATGGLPEVANVDWSYRQLRAIVDDSAASVFLFLTAVAAGVVLALFGVIDRGRGLAFCLGYLVLLVGVPLWMAANLRFPQRVSLSMYTVAALGVFLYLARELVDRPPGPEVPPPPRGPAFVGLIAVGCFMFGWAYHLVGWIDRPCAPHRAELQALEDRVTARGGFVFVFVQTGLVDFDPLRAQPRGYDGLQGGWGTFSTAWYETIARLGVHRGADVLGAMVDNPDAYLLGTLGARDGIEEWLRRKLDNRSVRLAIVDGADIWDGSRPELYHLVSTPPVRDSDEWRMMVRDELALAQVLPGPPSVSELSFRSVPFAPPYEQHASLRHHPAARIVVEPSDRGVRGTVIGESRDGCTVTREDNPYAGVHVPIDGLGAARFEIKLIDPENIVAVDVQAQSKTSRSVIWRWELSPQLQATGYTGTITLVPEYAAHRLRLVVNTARPRDLRDLHISIAVKPGTHAGFELRNLEIAAP